MAALGHRREELSAISGSLTLLSNVTMVWMTQHMQHVPNRWKKENVRSVYRDILRHSGTVHIEGVNFRSKFDFQMQQYRDRLLPKAARQI